MKVVRSPTTTESPATVAAGQSLTALWATLMFGLSSLTAVAQEATPVRVDGLAAVVGGVAPGGDAELVLHSDVALRAHIALSGRRQGRPPVGALPPALLKAALDETVGELLIAREARRIQASEVAEVDVARERQRLERQAGGRTRLAAVAAAVGAAPEELERIARRRALVAAFLSANLEGATDVTDAEVEKAYAEQAEHFEGRPALEVRAALRAQLARQAIDRNIKRWVQVLRARTPWRIYADYGR